MLRTEPKVKILIAQENNVNTFMEIDIVHYVAKCKEHEAKRLSFNERMKYWENYHKSLGRRSVDSVPINWAPTT